MEQQNRTQKDTTRWSGRKKRAIAAVAVAALALVVLPVFLLPVIMLTLRYSEDNCIVTL